jgi:RNA polymerase sigma factor (sigma-70 family)
LKAATAHDDLDAGGAASQGEVRPIARWLSILYRNQRDAVCGYLRRKYGSGPPEPEDVVQQAFARLAKLDWVAMQAIVKPRSFLYRTAENILISERRRELVRARHMVEDGTGLADIADSDPPADVMLVARDELSAIEAAIRLMPERRRAALLLHRIDGCSIAEIGRQLGISAPGARKHIEKALADIEAAVAAREAGA